MFFFLPMGHRDAVRARGPTAGQLRRLLLLEDDAHFRRFVMAPVDASSASGRKNADGSARAKGMMDGANRHGA